MRRYSIRRTKVVDGGYLGTLTVFSFRRTLASDIESDSGKP